MTAPDHGYRGEGAFAFALREGGPRNGVLTALEDALSDNPERKALITPLVFGLAVVGSERSENWPAVVDLMRPYTDNPTLAEMERNRLTLFLETLRLQDQRPRARAGRVKQRLLALVGRRTVGPRHV